MKVSFSLANKAKAKSANPPSALKPAAVFSVTDEEPVSDGSGISGARAAPLGAVPSVETKLLKKRIEAEQKVDSTVFEYDEVYDQMQDVKLRQKANKDAESKERKPKYISGLLTSAATRKLDYLRAEDKMIQREREAEGDEFADKEAFVTQAYKDQMAEVRRAEEEEKQREEAEKKKRGGKPAGLARFYQELLNETETQHQEAVDATIKKQTGAIGPQPNFTISKPAEATIKTDLELAKLAVQQGKSVELNDDNQIVDKRDLLSAGLNLSAPNTRRIGLHMSSKDTGADGAAQMHRAVGTAASRKQINERRAREIETQLQEEQDRMVAERERQERERTERVVAKRNSENDVQSARERFLQRKRRKLEEEPVQEG